MKIASAFFLTMNLLFINNRRALRAISLLTLLSFLIVGCFSPAIIAEKNQSCQLVTKKLELVLYEEGSQALTSGAFLEMLKASSEVCQTPECLLIIPLSVLAISVTSIIVSGSIVVVGNTIHWIEKEGKCQSSTTRTIVNNLINSIKAIGGKTIQSTNELITWFKQHLRID
jgi:Gpi18-like mannosyltransferase